MKLMHVVGARPNFVKIAPVMRAVSARGNAEQILVHTGQHYDPDMSRIFFDDLDLPEPDVSLGVGSGTHAQQTAAVMVGFESVCLARRPDLVLVTGDVNSTLAASLVAAKLGIPCAHLEAGLRSFDRTMPEEINRLVTDRICELLLTPSEDADVNLRAEGVDPTTIHRVGNVMIDSLLRHLAAARGGTDLTRWKVVAGGYAVVTLHRPSNVDAASALAGVIDALQAIARQISLVFPIHPRTRKQLHDQGLFDRLAGASGIHVCEPLGYIEFLALFSQAAFVITDSGGLQEESTALRIPCLTLRSNTERPITVSLGTNVLVGSDPQRIIAEAERVLAGKNKPGQVPPLWDGHAAERVSEVLYAWWQKRSA
jgi:UDP-N-acetylglucosamine 2-epimerase (non-hydrolysing)